MNIGQFIFVFIKINDTFTFKLLPTCFRMYEYIIKKLQK
jgi:hypothetical protein